MDFGFAERIERKYDTNGTYWEWRGIVRDKLEAISLTGKIQNFNFNGHLKLVVLNPEMI